MADKAIFLDRDDTLIEDIGFINNPDQVKLLDGVPEALLEMRQMGYKLVVVSNQSGVARGIVTEKVLGQIHERLNQLLAQKGAQLDRIYYCPYHPDGIILKYQKESDLRKPGPGMLLRAAEQMDIDLGQSWMIGNGSRDVEAGLQAGCKTILIDTPSHTKSVGRSRVNPDYRAVNIKEAVNIIKKHHRASDQPHWPQQPPAKTVEQQHNLQAADTAEDTASSGNVEQLLGNILQQLKSTQRADMFSEFSIMRLMAGIVQVVALFCLLISIWFLMSPTRQDSFVFIALGFAVFLQLMALTFYIMQPRK